MNKHKVLLESHKLFQLNALAKKVTIVLVAKIYGLYIVGQKQQDLFLYSFCCALRIITIFTKRAMGERILNLLTRLGETHSLSQAFVHVDDFKDGNHFKSIGLNFPHFSVLALSFIGTKNKWLVSVLLIANKLTCLLFCLNKNKSYFPLLTNLVSC